MRQRLIVVRTPPAKLLFCRIFDLLVDHPFLLRVLHDRHGKPVRLAIEKYPRPVLIVAPLELHMIEHNEQIGLQHPVKVAEPGEEMGLMHGHDHGNLLA